MSYDAFFTSGSFIGAINKDLDNPDYLDFIMTQTTRTFRVEYKIVEGERVVKSVEIVDPTAPIVLTEERRKEIAKAARAIRRAARSATKRKKAQKPKSKAPTAYAKSTFTKGILNRI